MDQTIGIRYEVKGQEQVFKTFDQMGTKLDTLNQKLATAGRGFQSFVAGARQAEPALKALVAGFGATGTSATAASTKVSTLTKDLATLRSASARPIGISVTGGVGGPPGAMGGGRAGAQSGFLGGYGPMGFMTRFMAYHQLIKGAQFLIKDVGMGGARKDIGKSLGELSSVGFNARQKQDTEIAGQDFATKFFDQTADQYIKAMSQTASAFSIDKLGSDQLNRLNASAMHTAKLSKMSPDQAGLLQSQLINAYIGAQSKGVYQSLQSGGTATTKAFGTTDLAGMGEKMMAQAAKAIEISNIWGKGMQDFQQYAGPVMYQKGWDPAAMMAMAGTMVDVGYKGAKAGRATKSMLADPKAFAKLQMLDEGLLTRGSTGAVKQREQEMLRERTGAINKAMKSGPEFFALLEKLIPGLKKAVALSESPEGLSLLKDIGISKDFLPQFLSVLKPGFLERVKGQYGQIQGAEYSEVLAKRNDQLLDNGLLSDRLTNSWGRLTSALAKGEGDIARATKGLSYLFNELGMMQERQNALADIGKWRRPEHEGGLVGEDMGKYKSSTELRDEIDRWGKKEYEHRVGLLGKEPSDKTGPDWASWKEKEQGIYSDTKQSMTKFWGEQFPEEKGLISVSRAGLQLEIFGASLESAKNSVINFGASLIDRTPGGPLPAPVPMLPAQPGGEFRQSSLEGSPQGGAAQGASAPPVVQVFIDGREIDGSVVRVLNNRDMVNRNRFGNSWT